MSSAAAQLDSPLLNALTDLSLKGRLGTELGTLPILWQLTTRKQGGHLLVDIVGCDELDGRGTDGQKKAAAPVQEQVKCIL